MLVISVAALEGVAARGGVVVVARVRMNLCAAPFPAGATTARAAPLARAIAGRLRSLPAHRSRRAQVVIPPPPRDAVGVRVRAISGSVQCGGSTPPSRETFSRTCQVTSPFP